MNRSGFHHVGFSSLTARGVIMMGHKIIFAGILYISKVVISICLIVCPIITPKSYNRFASNFDLGLWENHGNVHSLVLRF